MHPMPWTIRLTRPRPGLARMGAGANSTGPGSFRLRSARRGTAPPGSAFRSALSCALSSARIGPALFGSALPGPALLGSALIGTALLPTLALSQTYELVWQDEFEGTQVDLSKWEFQLGNGCPDLCGWGNNELQYYRAQNATVSDGMLTITAREQSFGGANYTSARLRTKDQGDWLYGRIEMRAKLPTGQGLWPAFWMLPTDGVYGVWAASGEIDIMEYVGQDPDRVFGTLHYGGTFPQNTYTSNGYTLPSGDFHEDFHVFALEWDRCEIRWYVDDVHYATQTDWWSSGGPYPAPFDQRFHLLLNLAVGGNLPGPPDETTVFPQELIVDYVRVYQERPDVLACQTEFDGMDHGNPFGNGWFAFGGDNGGGGIDPNYSDLPPIDGCRASLQTGWGGGGVPGYYGGFGRNNPLDLTEATHFNFWINPDAGQDYTLEINLQDDDDGDGQIPVPPDGGNDEFQYLFRVSPTGPDAISGGGWQRVSIPISEFADDNTYHWGGNGIFDPTPVSAGGNGELIVIVLTVHSESGADVTFRTDAWGFTTQTSSIAGRIWNDADGSGTPDGGEPGIPGVTVELVDTSLGQVVAADVTSADGSYLLDALLAGVYEVRVDPSTLPDGAIPTFDPDGTESPGIFGESLECDQAVTGRDFGYLPETSAAPSASFGEEVLGQNTPNPFGARTRIEFDVPSEGPVELFIVDAQGRRIKTLIREHVPAGPRRIDWDGRDDLGRAVPAGVYFYSLRTGAGELRRTMTVIQ